MVVLGSAWDTLGGFTAHRRFPAAWRSVTSGVGLYPMFYDGYGLPVWDYNLGSGQEHLGSAMRAQRQPFQYKGQAGYYADAHTGLYYCHHRYYNPVLARWMSVDPIGLEGGVNVYEYCSGDPVNRVDPSGLQTTYGYWFEKFNFDMRNLFNFTPQATGQALMTGFGRHVRSRNNLAYGTSWQAAWSILADWSEGTGPTERTYRDDSSVEWTDMRSSLGFAEVIGTIKKMGYLKSSGPISKGVGTSRAAWLTLKQPGNGTQAQVGAFEYNAWRKGDTIRIKMWNKLTPNSFFLHAWGRYEFPSGPMRTIRQTWWYEIQVPHGK